jgi:ABC-type lipoprotein release transport system permease subunit
MPLFARRRGLLRIERLERDLDEELRSHIEMRTRDNLSGDPLTYAGISAVPAAVTLLACPVPARRATRVDALAALRQDSRQRARPER